MAKTGPVTMPGASRCRCRWCKVDRQTACAVRARVCVALALGGPIVCIICMRDESAFCCVREVFFYSFVTVGCNIDHRRSHTAYGIDRSSYMPRVSHQNLDGLTPLLCCTCVQKLQCARFRRVSVRTLCARARVLSLGVDVVSRR